MITESDAAAVQSSQGFTENTENFVTRLLPGLEGEAAEVDYHCGKRAALPAPRDVTPGTVRLTATSPTVADLTALRGGRDRLLPVGEVAEELGVCTATVYRLCERGDLPHVRIINSIRVRPRDLAAFVATSGRRDA